MMEVWTYQGPHHVKFLPFIMGRCGGAGAAAHQGAGAGGCARRTWWAFSSLSSVNSCTPAATRRLKRPASCSGAAALGQQLTKARAQVDAARTDNVALLERLKYVQGFAGRRSGGSPQLLI